MTTEKKKGASPAQVLTPEFRVSYPAVFVPRAAVEGAEAKYSVSMIFPKVMTNPEDVKKLQAMKQLAADALVKKFGPDKTKWPVKNVGTAEKPVMVSALRSPFRSGAEKDDDGYGPDVIFCSASAGKRKPGLVDQKRQAIIDPNEFYGGCYAHATVTAYGYDKAVNKGVAFGLQNIQKTRDGEPFSSRSTPENDFDAIEMPAGDGRAEAAGGSADSDPLGGLGA